MRHSEQQCIEQWGGTFGQTRKTNITGHQVRNRHRYHTIDLNARTHARAAHTPQYQNTYEYPCTYSFLLARYGPVGCWFCWLALLARIGPGFWNLFQSGEIWIIAYHYVYVYQYRAPGRNICRFVLVVHVSESSQTHDI